MHRILVLTAGGLLAVGAALLPTAYYQNIPTARYVTASTQLGTESVSCSGQILAFDRAETYITSPVVTEDVLVEVGDQVAAGQVLCTVDLPATGLLMTSPELTSDFLKSYLENPETSSLESLLSASGLGEQSVQLAAAPEYASAINGTVTAVNLQSDSLYNSPQAAIVVEDLSELRAELYVPQAGVAGIEPGDKVLIQGAGITGEISGEVVSINPSAMQSLQNGTLQVLIPVQVRLTSDSKGARPGYAVTAQILSRSSTDGLFIPYQAVCQDEENQEYVWLLSNTGAAVRQPVTTGEETAEMTQILSGITAEDIVLIGENLQSGQPVRLEGYYEG